MGPRHILPIIAAAEFESMVNFLGLVSFMVCNCIIWTMRSLGLLDRRVPAEVAFCAIDEEMLMLFIASRREFAHMS